jgi:hypothetical protein
MTVFLRLCKCTKQAHDVSSNPPLSSTIACPTVNPPTSSRVPTLTNIYETRLRLWNGQNPMKRRWVIMFFSFWMYRNTRDLTHHLQIDVYAQANAPKLHQPHLNTQRHRLMCLSCSSIYFGLRDSHRRRRHQKIARAPPFGEFDNKQLLNTKMRVCSHTTT